MSPFGPVVGLPMLPLTPATLKVIMPRADASAWSMPLNAAMIEFSIATPLRSAAFLAMLAEESIELTCLRENLNYSDVQRIVGVFRCFDEDKDRQIEPAELEKARLFVHQPEKLANHVYANRNGNGDEASGDGFRYRGGGPPQLTGRANYRACGTALGLQLELYPEHIVDPAYGARAAAWFWDVHRLNALADKGDITGITKVWNGGTNGLEQRKAYYAKAREVLTVAAAA